MSNVPNDAAASTRCPVCKDVASHPTLNAAFPFCTVRCRTIDLGRWFDGAYALEPSTGALTVIDPDEAEVIE